MESGDRHAVDPSNQGSGVSTLHAPRSTQGEPAAALRARIMRSLHAAAARRGMSHDLLRDVATTAYGVASMTDLTLTELRDLNQRLGTRPNTARGRGGEGETRRRGDAATRGHRRDRRGSGGEAGLKMISPAQRRFIQALRAELGWTAEQLDTFIDKHLDGLAGDGLAGVRTSADASVVINYLIGVNRQRQRPRRTPREAQVRSET